MSKRILSLVLTLALVLGTMSTAFAATAPKDVIGTDVEDAVTRLGKLGILTGYTDGTFRPDGNITRAEFSAVVSRARGLEQAAINSKGNTKFGDVSGSHWASGYVNVADDAGLVKGVGVINGVNTFGPERNITYEQAVTLIVRALGYEPAAQANGGYPNGHLIVASQEGLLKGIKAVQGQTATRGLVATLTDNALDVAKMIQSGYGDQAKYVKSGTENTTEVFLFDDLGLDRLVKAVITEADSSKNKVTIKGYKYKNDTREISKSLKVDEDFNFAGLEGLKVTAWYDDAKGTLVDVRLDTDYTVTFDAIEITKDEKELKLIKADKKYDISKDAVVRINGTKESISELEKGDEYNFAKIIVDEYNDISWIDAYELDELIVVKEAKDKVIKGYGNEEISDANKYTIIKDGKEISVSDLDDEDVVLYDSKEEYAVVITDVREGKIDRVYDTGFRFDGETYDYKTDYGQIQYVNGDDLEDVDSDVAEEMQDNGNIKLFFSFDDKVLVMDGDVKEISSNYVMVSSDTKSFDTRGETYKTLDVLNDKGTVVKYEVKLKDINDSKEDFLQSETAWNNAIKAGNVIKLSVDSKDNPSKVETTNSKTIKSTVDVDASYIEGYKTKGNSVVFWSDGEEKVKDYSVIKWSEAKANFSEIQEGTVFADKDGNVVAVYADKTNNETKTTDVVGIVRKVKELSKKDNRYDITLEVNGKETTYEGKSASFANLDEEDIVALKITKDDEAKSWSEVDTKVVKVDKATASKLEGTKSGESYTVEGKYYEEGKYELKTMNAKDVVGKTVTLYFQPGSSKFVQVVVLGDHGTEEKVDTAKLATAIADAEKAVTEGKTDASVKALEKAITDAKALINNTKATQEEVDAAVVAVNNAVKGLINEDTNQDQLKATFEAKNIFGQWALVVTLSDAAKLNDVKTVTVDETVVAHQVANGKIAAKLAGDATLVELELNDGTKITATK